MSRWPESLKPVAKYMARAREVENVDPLVSYYCNYYSLKRCVELRDPTDEKASQFLTGLLEKCDRAKATLPPDDGTHRQHLEDFALHVFNTADDEDRAGMATKQTAQTFFAAMCFFEVCTALGPLSPELQNRMQYAQWKAGDILKALKQGLRPVPGPPGGIQQEQQEQQEQQQDNNIVPTPYDGGNNNNDNSNNITDVPTSATEVNDGSNMSKYPDPVKLDPAPGEHIPPSSTSSSPSAAPPKSSVLHVPPAPEEREYDADVQSYEPEKHLKRKQQQQQGTPYQALYPSHDSPPPPPSLPSIDDDNDVHSRMNNNNPYSTPPTVTASSSHQHTESSSLHNHFNNALSLQGQDDTSQQQYYSQHSSKSMQQQQHHHHHNWNNQHDDSSSYPNSHHSASVSSGMATPPEPSATTTSTTSHAPINVTYPTHQPSVTQQQPQQTMAPPKPKSAPRQPSVTDIIHAQKLAKSALSALDFRDLATARANLQKALELISE